LFTARRGGIDQKMTIVVGAGLAGLTCARVLAGAGRKFVLLEAADRPGGRVVSRRTAEGFVLDRGFQVLLDSYPTARRHLDFDALGGGRFRAGAMFVGQGVPRVFENPLRRPASVFSAVTGGLLPRSDQWRLAKLAARAVAGWRPPEISTEELLQSMGFSEVFFACFARPFFGGVLLDPALAVSARLFTGYLGHFVKGRALLPGEGMGALGAQLAARLPGESVRYGCRVEQILFSGAAVAGVTLSGGDVVRGGQVVLAVDEPAVCRLLGRGAPRRALGTVVHYFAAARAFHQGSWLCLPPRRAESPVCHAALVSNAAPSLAPAGAHLWSVTVLPGHPRAMDAGFVAREVASWFGADSAELQPIDCVAVPYAVPFQGPGREQLSPAWGELPPGLGVTGDAVCGASIEAVMESGERAAKKVISSGAPG